MKRSKSLFTCVLIGIMLCQSTAQAPFNKGVNLSNWFQKNSAQEVQLYQYDANDFEEIKSLGCDVIRLPINLIAMTNGAPDFQVDPMFFFMLDSVVSWAEQIGLHLIIDNHTFDPSQNTSPEIQEFLVKVWPQIAYRYRNSYENLYYEILNEPHGISNSIWNNIQGEVIDKIRLVDQEHYLIVGPADWNSFHSLKNLPEYEDEKLIYTFHFYDPFLFTHQGASWVDPDMQSLTGVPFPYEANSMPDLPANFIGTWLESSYNAYPEEGKIAHVQSLLDIAREFKQERNVPLFCGEFGVLHQNVEKEEDRNLWYGVIRNYLEEYGIAWTIWDYHGGFGLYEKNSDGLFDHDLNIPLLESLGLNIPDQSEYTIKADSAGFVVYDDFIGKDIVASNNTDSPFSFYAEDNPVHGNHSISWRDPSQYQHVGFDFIPNRDLSSLRKHDFTLDFWIKANQPSSKIDLRFIDTKTGVDGDRPWRIRYTLDESVVTWNGEWQRLSLKLKDFEEHGSWDENTWFEPIGAFDWTKIDRLEFVDEYGLNHPIEIGLDLIEINGEAISNTKNESFTKKTLFYPNPVVDRVLAVESTENYSNWKLFDLLGKEVDQGRLEEGITIEFFGVHSGFYFLHLITREREKAESIKIYIP